MCCAIYRITIHIYSVCTEFSKRGKESVSTQIACLFVFGKVPQQAAIAPIEQAERLRQVVILQRGQVIVLNGERVAGLDQEVIVQALVVKVMADGRQVPCMQNATLALLILIRR